MVIVTLNRQEYPKTLTKRKEEKIQEIFNKELEEIKNRQLAMKNTVTVTKITLERTKSRITEAKEWISELEDRTVEITEAEQNKEKKNEKK